MAVWSISARCEQDESQHEQWDQSGSKFSMMMIKALTTEASTLTVITGTFDSLIIGP